MKCNIRHVWFDFSETLVFLKNERLDKLRHETYAEAVGRPVSNALKDELAGLYVKFNKSNAAIFHSLGLPAYFWPDKVSTLPPGELYELADKNIPEVLQKLKQFVPISIFSNLELTKVLPGLGIQNEWFTHMLSSKVLEHLKPALDGYYKMIELSKLPAEQILYIGDDVGKDVRPAKEVGIKAGIMWKASNEADYSFKNFEEVLKLF